MVLGLQVLTHLHLFSSETHVLVGGPCRYCLTIRGERINFFALTQDMFKLPRAHRSQSSTLLAAHAAPSAKAVTGQKALEPTSPTLFRLPKDPILWCLAKRQGDVTCGAWDWVFI